MQQKLSECLDLQECGSGVEEFKPRVMAVEQLKMLSTLYEDRVCSIITNFRQVAREIHIPMPYNSCQEDSDRRAN